MKVYQAIAAKLMAQDNCRKSGNEEWLVKHGDAIEALISKHLPSGAGFDSGTTLDYDKSTPERLTFYTAFHHMNDAGYYGDWTDHAVIVTPSLANGFTLRVTGRDRNGIKDYIAEVFDAALNIEASRG